MKRVLPKITAVVLLAMAVTACSGQDNTSEVSGSVEVLSPINDSKNGYSLKFIELSGLDNLREVSGRFVRFFISPRILDNRLNGPAPQGRFIKNTDGKYIPANEQSQQLVAIYAHMQSLAKLDEEVGAGGVNHWPRDIGVSVRESSGLINNALYDGTTDSILIVPYTNKDLPIAVNGGILAHEHFHSLYFKLVMKGFEDSSATDGQIDTGSIHDRRQFLQAAGVETGKGDVLSAKPNPRVETDSNPKLGSGRMVSPASEKLVKRYYNRYYHRGLNEGLADFWGWVYTGDPDFISPSLPAYKRQRSLNIAQYEVVSLVKADRLRDFAATYTNFNNRESYEEYMRDISYALGTKYSRLLKLFTDTAAETRGVDSIEMRKKMATWLVAALPVLRQDFLAYDSTQYYPPTRFLSILSSVISDMSQKECEFLVEVINSTEENTNKICVAAAKRYQITDTTAAKK
ncbi:hypothetical protein B9G69_001270 [Bdellovibrio sp. SKB1291214]|uniref:hypothetical protein n=1 Tax=Bdellovibrio sp. SKB1291214 TaxID=1732569 RepID=UPI000B514D5A|nr:hypothetical protein [Bdellovibrio sp. SKB1291214]UYL09206.1 hypothetical protein B9G69_001270 [Bdellovibrio sp. SKB1291214]